MGKIRGGSKYYTYIIDTTRHWNSYRNMTHDMIPKLLRKLNIKYLYSNIFQKGERKEKDIDYNEHVDKSLIK